MVNPNKGYEDLDVWRFAIELCTSVYDATKPFPKEEIFGLSLQLRKSAVSIASNIAEGCGRYSAKEFLQFLSIASGSTAELKTQIIIARETKLFQPEIAQNLLTLAIRIERMLTGLVKSLRNPPTTYNLQPETSDV